MDVAPIGLCVVLELVNSISKERFATATLLFRSSLSSRADFLSLEKPRLVQI